MTVFNRESARDPLGKPSSSGEFNRDAGKSGSAKTAAERECAGNVERAAGSNANKYGS